MQNNGLEEINGTHILDTEENHMHIGFRHHSHRVINEHMHMIEPLQSLLI